MSLNTGITHTNQFIWSKPIEKDFDGLGPFQVWETSCKSYKVCRCDGGYRRFTAIANRLKVGKFDVEEIIGNDLTSLYDAFLVIEKDFFNRNGIAMESNVLEIMKEAKEHGLHKLKKEEHKEEGNWADAECALIHSNGEVIVKEKKRGRKGIGTNGMSGLDACVQVLSNSEKPLSNIEILTKITEQGLWSSRGKSPANVVKSIIMNDIKKGDKARLKKVSRGLFSIK